MIRHCDGAGTSCYSPFQDGMYGNGMRVMNEILKAGKVRCTVCQKEHSNVVKKADNSKKMGVKKK